MTGDALPTEEASVVDAYINYDGNQQNLQQIMLQESLKENIPRAVDIKISVSKPGQLSAAVDSSLVADDERLYNLAAALVSFSTQPFAADNEVPNKTDIRPGEQTDFVYDDDDGPIQAYAKIEGQGWVYFMKKPSCVFGKAPTTEMQYTAGQGKDAVDFYLTCDDLISPLHLRIEYSPDRLCWEALCVGKTAILIDNVNVEPFSPPHPLKLRSSIKLSTAVFEFIQPGPHELNSSGSSRSSTPLSEGSTTVSVAGSEKLWKIYDPLKAGRGKSRKSRQINQSSESRIGEELVKPSQSYACLIAEAINSIPEKRMTLSGIYQFLADHYPYFRQTKNGWQNSVRHNLSLNKAFKKVPREIGEQGKGMFWIVDPDFEYLVKGSSGRRSISRSRSATPGPHTNGVFDDSQPQPSMPKNHSLKNPYFPTPIYGRPLSASPTSFVGNESISGISALSSATLFLSMSKEEILEEEGASSEMHNL